LIDYLRLARACRTENELNRLHILIENRFAPAEIAAIRSAAREFRNERTRRWLKRLRGMSPTLMKRPKPFERSRLHRNVIVYRCPHHDRDGKRALIAFPGAARRLGMPIAVFLQCMESEWDVFLVTRPDQTRSYLDGWNEDAPGIHAITEVVRSVSDLDAYGGVSVIGNSSGGLPAIVAACVIGADAGVSVSGTAGGTAEGRPSKAADVLAAITQFPRLSFTYCAGNEADAASAAFMRRMTGTGDLLPVAACATHNAAANLLQEGTLPTFLADVLGKSATPPDRWQTYEPGPSQK